MQPDLDPQNGSAIRPLIIRGLALCGGLLVGLVAAEAVLRLLGAAPTNGVATVTEGQFRSLPGMLAPGQDLIDRRDPRLPHHVTTNTLGYRGSEVPEGKPPGELRVLFVGDSFVFGDFVNDDQTLPAQLERRLRARCANVRVVNAGLDDATLTEETALIDRGFRLAPDLVILLFSENDVADLNRISTWDQLAANRRAKSRFPLGTFYPLLRRTALWNFALMARARGTSRTHGAQPTTGTLMLTAAGRGDSLTRALRDTYRHDLLGLRDTLAQRGVPLVLAVYPSHLALTHAEMRDQVAWITETAAETKVAQVNLLAPLLATGLPAEQVYLLPFDGHPSHRGYEITAGFLADQLDHIAGAGSAIRKSCK